MIIIKTIGIILRDFKENNKQFSGTRYDLFNFLFNYNVNVIGIPINNDFNKTKNIVDICDGIILSGGDTFVYQDFLLIDYLYKEDKPTLGICLGMQSMAKYFSDKDEIDVKNHLSNDLYVHYIKIDKNSLLYKILKKDRILVNSRHKSQIIDTSLKISALSDDGVVEAVEDSYKKFFVGVEWHPESLNDKNTKLLIDYFISTL